MNEPEKPTHEQALRDAINTDAGVVNTHALVAYLESRIESCREYVMRTTAEPRVADVCRGKHAEACDLIRLLTTPNPETP